MGRGSPFLSIRCSLSARRRAKPTPHKNGPNRFLCAPMRRQSRRLAGAAVRTAARRHIKPPAGEVPERSEGGGEVKEGESGRATAGSDKRPRPSNTHEEARRRAKPTPHKQSWFCVAVPNTAFWSSDRGGAIESDAQRRRAAAKRRRVEGSAGA